MKLFIPFEKSAQKGSVTVFVAFLMPVMILMIALVVNISQLVFTKIKLQNTVDACALSAAAVQAAGLNEIADLNIEMSKEYAKIKDILKQGTWYSKSNALNAKNFFYNKKNGVIDHIKRYQQTFNKQFALHAEDVAQHVRELNMPRSILNPKHPVKELTGLKGLEKRFSYTYYRRSDPDDSRPTVRWYNSREDNPEYYGKHDASDESNRNRRSRAGSKFTILERMQKRGPTYVEYELTLPPGQFIMAGSIFGQFPELSATAVARPAGGNIYKLSPYYQAVLVK